MKTLHIISLFIWFTQPINIRAKPGKGISDFDASFKGIERIDFE